MQNWLAFDSAQVNEAVLFELARGNYQLHADYQPAAMAADISEMSLLAQTAASGNLPPLAAAPDVRVIKEGQGLIDLQVRTVLSINHQGLGQPPRRPVPYAASLEDDIQLLGYDLPRTTWRAGEDVTLRLYSLAGRTPDRNYRVFVHLVMPDDSARVAQTDNDPNLGFRPTTRWSPGELIIDEQQMHLAPNTPAGKDRLLVGMYRPEDMRNLAVRSAPTTLPGDRLDLGEITITAGPR